MYLGILALTKWRKLCEKLQFTRETEEERKMVGEMQIKRDGLVLPNDQSCGRSRLNYISSGATTTWQHNEQLPPGQT